MLSWNMSGLIAAADGTSSTTMAKVEPTQRMATNTIRLITSQEVYCGLPMSALEASTHSAVLGGEFSERRQEKT